MGSRGSAIHCTEQPGLGRVDQSHVHTSSVPLFVSVGSSSQLLRSRIERIAPSDATVLISGETGTGKELAARQIHALSRRSQRAFVAVNCGAFSETLVDGELFGYERGAFTGAVQSRPGWFESAQGGTLFLDEISDLPLPIQVKLLRVLQQREVTRIGSRRVIPLNVRIVAASNITLEEAVRAGRFRQDLFYRLRVATLELRPLRERTDDILPLARHFINVYSVKLGIEAITLSPHSERALLAHSWPGNIRELENVMHQALLVCCHGVIQPSDLYLVPAVSGASKQAVETAVPDLEKALFSLFNEGSPDLYDGIEATVMRSAYRYCRHNQLRTARLLGISRNIVRARLKKIGEIVSD